MMPVRLISWNRYGLCGAASAQMVLHALNSGQTGITNAEQEALWTSIKQNTVPPSGNAGAACDGDIPSTLMFANMAREACGNNSTLCWLTYPDALDAALRAALQTSQSPTSLQVTLRRFSNQARANDAIKQCLAGGGLSIVLINNATHWVVVYEWKDSGRKPVRVLDPVGFRVKHTVEDWNDYSMIAVDCAQSQFFGNYVVVEVK